MEDRRRRPDVLQRKRPCRRQTTWQRSRVRTERASGCASMHLRTLVATLLKHGLEIRFIEDRRADYPVMLLCDVLGVSPAGDLRLALAPGKPRIDADRNIVDDIRRSTATPAGVMAKRISTST